MSHQKVRKENTCQNCGKYVSNRYCPHCGQENIEVHYSFPGLVHHFAADLFHYDSSIWLTIRYLLTSPGKLAKEYIAGKRKTYVDPIKLYIFISFITFFTMGILSPYEKPEVSGDTNTIKLTVTGTNKHTGKPVSVTLNSTEQLDSINNSGDIIFKEHYTTKYLLKAAGNISDEHKLDQVKEFANHNLPKVLFVYMPIFAFWLWIFHYKQKRYYSDSGIFTLYFFSFILLLSTITIIFKYILGKFDLKSDFGSYIVCFNIIYTLWYFFKAHLYFFEEKKSVSFLKSTAITIIATILISCILLLYVLYAFVAI